MFIIVLRLTGQRDKARQLMEAHKAWIAEGFSDGAFIFVGTLAPGVGGILIALGDDREAIEGRVRNDPFVADGVADAEIMEVAPGRVDPRLALLSAAAD
jgi:uncharacterized protein YciI